MTRTFSKMYGLAGARVGYVVGNRKLLERMRIFGNTSGVCKLSCDAASAAIDDRAFVERVKKMTDEGKDYLYGELDKMGLRYTPSHSAFVLIDLEQDAAKVQERLLGLGLYAGPADGTFCEPTLDAVGAFQEAQDLHVSGVPSPMTRERLFADAG